jgi:hypothetical protein
MTTAMAAAGAMAPVGVVVGVVKSVADTFGVMAQAHAHIRAVEEQTRQCALQAEVMKHEADCRLREHHERELTRRKGIDAALCMAMAGQADGAAALATILKLCVDGR